MKNEVITIKDMPYPNCAQVNKQGYLLVKDIEHWITGLVSVQTIKEASESKDYPALLCMQDAETNAKFVIGKVIDEDL